MDVIVAGSGGAFNYNAGNINGGFNCTGFACYALETGGLAPPLPSTQPYLHPNNLFK